MEDRVQTLKISNEDDAYIILKQALNDELPDNVKISFEGWPVLDLKIKGEDFNATIPSRILQPLIELQREVNKIYCRSRYNSEATQRLTDEERDALELIIQVNQGSTELFSQMGKIFNETIEKSNMNGKQVATILIAVAFFYTSHSAWKEWLIHKEKIHSQELSASLSDKETERLKLFTEAVNSNNDALKAIEGFDLFRSSLAKKLKPSDEIHVSHEKIISGEQAQTIVYSPAVETEIIRISGKFTITNIGFPSTFGEPYKLHVKRINDGLVLTVEASHANISEPQIEIITNAGFGIKVVNLQINAQKKNGEISKPKLYSISWGEEPVSSN